MIAGKYALASLVVPAAWFALTAEPDHDGTLAQPAETAIARIKAERRIVEGTGLGSLTIASEGTDGQKLLVSVEKAGEPRRVKCRVAISPVSLGESSADVDCTQPGPDEPVGQLGSKAMAMIVREHVVAAVEKRPYDIDKIADRMIALAAMNGPILAASIPPPRE